MKVTLSKLLPLFFIAEATSQTIETQISDFEIAGNGTEYIITYQNEGCFENAQADPTLFSSTFVSIYPNEKMIVKRIESHIERENIEQQDCVRYVEPNYVASITADEKPYGINMVQALDVEDLGFDDSDEVADMKVCILDTGLANHPDIPSKYVEGFGYYPVGDEYTHYVDRQGHGTHVAGTIAALSNDEGVIGVLRSPNTRLVIGKVLNDRGSGSYANIMDGLTKCMQKGAKVINMSLGGGGYLQSFQDKVNELHEAGIMIVAAAGNGGSSGRFYPASYDHVISVAAVNSNQNRASFSQFNDRIDLAAPGVSVKSTCIGNSYCIKSGTSMASPHVAGVVALVWSHFPNVNHTQINNVLEKTAKDLGTTGRDNYYGHGLVQAKEAYNQLIKDSPPAPAPTPTPPPPPPPSDFNFTIGKGKSNYDDTSSTLYMGHSIGLSATNAKIQLFYEGCVDPIPNKELLEVVNEEFDREKYADDGYDFYYGIKLHTENIAGGDERIVKNINQSGGSISFCGEVYTTMDGIDGKISRLRTEFTFKYSLTSGSFEVSTIKTEEFAGVTNEEIFDIVEDITITACLCDASFTCNENPENIILQDNSLVSICLKQQTDGKKLEFRSILLQMISNNGYLYEPVKPNADGLEEGANALTTITVNENTFDVLVETYLVTELFSATQSALTVKGTAEMDFSSNARSDSVRQFSLQLLVKGKDDKSAGCVLTKMFQKLGIGPK